MLPKTNKNKLFSFIIWSIIAIAGGSSFAAIAIIRGESVSSLWFIIACISFQLIAYRFYSAFIAAKILSVNSQNLTPATKFNDGKDYIPTNKWIVFGHHFAAIAGPGPLIGPTLAAQFGYLPGTIWILLGCIFAGAVQDMVILFASIRRDGKSLGQMIKDEIGSVAGYAALIGTLVIIIILIAVLGLVVVKALMHSPWGTFTVLMTIPIAIIVGLYLYFVRPNGVLEASIVGILLFCLSVYFGKIIHHHPYLSSLFDRSGEFLAISIIIYGFLAAVLPVWLLLAPRDYLSSFLKLGTIALLAISILIFQPDIKMPALTNFIDGSGPIFSGKIFPFLFITIACGAISGFHALVASGTTPKIISNEKDIRLVGYGSMLLEGGVAMMAIIAATILEPGIFFAINSPAAVLGNDPASVISSWGFSVTNQQVYDLAQQVGENTLFSRTGGAPSLAVGMASIFASAFGQSMIALWYHFAIMFEAVFILTTLDAGTRVARFMLEDFLRQIFKINPKNKIIFGIFTSFLIVCSWGYFLYIGIIDPNGGVNMLWPLFGMSNQMLAGIALSFATIVIYKKSPDKKYFLITLIPLSFVAITTSFAVFQKVFSDDVALGFIAQANIMQSAINNGTLIGEELNLAKKMIFNQKLLSFLALSFLVILWIVIIETIRTIINQANTNKKMKIKKTT